MAPINYSIKDIEKVVKFEGKVKNVQMSRLTAPGENYMSLVLRVDFEVEKDGHSKTISSVSKCLSLSAQNSSFKYHGHAMRNEIKWYTEILPLLKDFAKENEIKMEFYPEYYGSRYSLNSSQQIADSDSVLILENLIPQGYQNDDRYVGCDLNTSKAVLKTLALYHALPIAVKLKKPETFKIIKDFLYSTRLKFQKVDDSVDPDEEKKPIGPPPGAEKPIDVLCQELVKIPEFAPYLFKIKSLLENQQMGPDELDNKAREPWNTIVHNDFWVNNVMTKATNAEEPLVKVVDYQMGTYGSYAEDLLFFLLTSVRNDVVIDHMDDLLRVYYDEFTSVLQKTHTGLELTYEDYIEEVRNSAVEAKVAHALQFATIVFGEKGAGVDAAVEEFKPHIHMVAMLRNMNQYQKDKLVLIASEATKRNWIKSF